MTRLLVALIALACGCASRLPQPETTTHPSGAFVPVPFPPPPARPEFVPAQPSPAAVWIDGEWRWRRTRWAWVYGRWVEPPGGARFAPWSWHRDAGGQLHYAPGTWRDERGAAIDYPPPIKLANADEGDVPEDVGILEDVGANVTVGARPRWRGRAPSPCERSPDVDDAAVPKPERERCGGEDEAPAERRPAE